VATQQFVLLVLSGIHAGATIELEPDTVWTIGSGATARVLLADEGTEEIHANLRWSAEAACWMLHASHAGVSVLGHVVDMSTGVPAGFGARFRIGPVQCEMARSAGRDMRGHPGIVRATEEERRVAMLLLRRQVDRRAYVLSVAIDVWRKVRLPACVIVITGVLGVLSFQLFRSDDALSRRRAAIAMIQQRFPNVHAVLDTATDITTYSGYVAHRGDLQSLRQYTLQADAGRSLVAVAPMDVAVANVGALLDPYYSDMRISIDGPGSISVELPSGDVMKELASWDLRSMEERIMREIPEIHTVRLAVRSVASKTVRLPLAEVGYSVIPSPSEYKFVVSESGQRFFAGARLAQGRLASVSACGVALDSSSESTIFDMFDAHVANMSCQPVPPSR
jgi:hypothetical protein